MTETIVLHIGSRQIISQDIVAVSTDVEVASIFSRPRIGQSIAILDNHSSRYSPERSFSFGGVTGQSSASLAGGNQESAIDAKIGCASFWFKRATTGREIIWETTSATFRIEFNAGNALHWTVANSNATVIGDVETTAAFTNTTSWHHALLSWDMATASIDVFVDDASQGLTTNTALANSNVDWTRAGINLMGQVEASNLAFTGTLGQAYINVRESLDITDSTVRRKFINSEGKPVDLLQFGEGPSGRMPYMFLPFISALSFNANYGYGQPFSEVSSLTHVKPSDIDVSPSDFRAGVPYNLSLTTDAGSSYQMFTGRVRASSFAAELGRQQLRIEAEDEGHKLTRFTKVPFGFRTVVQSVVVDVLSSVGITQTSLDALPDKTAFADLDDQRGGEAIARILETGAHYSFIAPDGSFVLKERNHDIDRLPVASLVTSFFGLSYSLDTDRVMNGVTVEAEVRAPTANVQTIAALQNSIGIFIPASGSPGAARDSNIVTFTIDYQDPETQNTGIPVQSVVTPVASTNFALTENVDGSGYDITSAVVTSFQGFARHAIFTIENTTQSNAVISRFHLEGHPVQTVNTFGFTFDDLDSIERFERREFNISSELLDDPNFAKSYAEFLLIQYSQPTARVSFGQVNRDPQIYEIGLMDSVHVVESNSLLGKDFLVERMTHTIRAGAENQEHSVDYELRASLDKEYMILDDPVRGISDDGNRLGF